jgi:seryl-tRNA synthetase
MQVTGKEENIASLNGRYGRCLSLSTLSHLLLAYHRIIQEQNLVQELQCTIQALKQDLGSALTREQSLQQEAARAIAEQSELKLGIQTANDSLEEVKKELEDRITT